MTKLDDLRTVLHAADFAAKKHRDQRRKNGEIPYINHPVSVARRLAELGGVEDPITLAAALLHDTVEDTETSPDEIESVFGPEIASVVAEVTDDKSLSKVERKRAQIRHASSISTRARMVKMADKLDNLDGMTTSPPTGWDTARIRGYFAWGHAVVAQARGVNPALEQALDELFARDVTHGDAVFRAVPEEPAEREALLASYMDDMAKRK
jgi:guanosine-3',5'-bis(diphosphate) 3'-pyrophosphohydrolase